MLKMIELLYQDMSVYSVKLMLSLTVKEGLINTKTMTIIDRHNLFDICPGNDLSKQ